VQRRPENEHVTTHTFKTAAVLCPPPQQVTLVLYPSCAISFVAPPKSHIAGYRTSAAICLPTEIAHLEPLYRSESTLVSSNVNQRRAGRCAQGPQSYGRQNRQSTVRTSSCIDIKRSCDTDIPELPAPNFVIHDKHNVCTIDTDPQQYDAELRDFYPRDNVIPIFPIGNKRYAIFPLRVVVFSEAESLNFNCDRLATELHTSLFEGALRYCPELFVSKIRDLEDSFQWLEPWSPPEFDVLSIHCVGITVIMDHNDWNIPFSYHDAITNMAHFAQNTIEEHLNTDEFELLLNSRCIQSHNIPEQLRVYPEFTQLPDIKPQFANRKTRL